jgi:sRNA-binding carbon storage regulator CsrA
VNPKLQNTFNSIQIHREQNMNMIKEEDEQSAQSKAETDGAEHAV